jgi:TolB-like protein/cytochrome c-type biogenesis protein CcmH/NrfG
LAVQHPDNWRVFDLLSEGLRMEGKFTESVAANERARRLAPDNFLVKGNRLSLLSRNGDWAAAEQELAVMLQGRISARILAFDVLLKLVWRGDTAGAVAAVQGWPAWFLLEDRGVVHAVLAALWNRNPTLALQYVQKYPRDYVRDYMFTGPTAVLSALANEQAGNLAAAQADWRVVQQVAERELREKPKEGYALHWKAWALARLGDPTAAAPILQQLLETNPFMRNMPRVFGRFGGLALAMGRSDVALAQIAQQPRVTTKASMRLNPVFDALRADPRFQALIESAPGPAESKPDGTADNEATNKSVAVLAFANLSDDKANEYFSDGISEELLNVLAKVPGLKVSARTSAFYFKGKEVPVPEIAKQLGVAYVVEGSVRKAGDKVRITAQLIKAADGFHVWSDTFTRDLKDIFAVQDEIAGLIAKNLSLKMGMTSSSETLDAEVLPLYYAALQAWNLRTLEGMDRAEALLNRALGLAPNFARGHAAMAKVWAIRGELTDTLSPFGMREGPLARTIREKVDQALALDPNCAEAYGALGVLSWDTWRTDEAAVALRRATQLNPNYASAHQWLGRVLSSQGHLDEGIVSLQRAVEVDPLSQRILDNCGRLLYLADRPREALAMAERALVIQPSAIQAQALKAQALFALGQSEEAVRIARTLPSNLAIVTIQKVQVLADAGHLDEVEQMLPQLTGANLLAKVGALSALGRKDAALSALDPNWFSANRADVLLFDHLLDPVRREPAFLRLLDQLGLREAHQRAQAWRAAHSPGKPAGKK